MIEMEKLLKKHEEEIAREETIIKGLVEAMEEGASLNRLLFIAEGDEYLKLQEYAKEFDEWQKLLRENAKKKSG